MPRATWNHYTRLHNIETARTWIGANIAKGSRIQVAYWCFGPEVFFYWLKYWLEVPVPREGDTGYDFRIWWGQKSSLAEKSGYACISPDPGRGQPRTVAWRRPKSAKGSEIYAGPVFRFRP